MARYFFDIESDGLLDTITKIHSLVLIDADTGFMHSFAGPRGEIPYGLKMLAEADEIIGHNIINFDIPAIKKVFRLWTTKAKITDTLILSRLLCPNMFDLDVEDRKRRIRRGLSIIPGKLTGSHGLKAWGYRLNVLKGEYGETADWLDWSQEMQSYCEQDVVVTCRLYDHLMAMGPSPQAVELEHKFATIISMQMEHGFAFNESEAVKLYQTLVQRRLELKEHLLAAFPPKRVETTFIPKVNNRKAGYVKGVPFTKVKYVEFNPSSRQMIGERLQELGWEPEEFTPSGQPKIDETILSKLPYDEAKVLAEHFLVEKRIGQLAEGDQAWLKLCRSGRIHGSVNTNGAVTGRCTHSNPNVAQVPRVGSAYGAECRSLFTVREGYVLVGADLAGLELRCLAHFMAWWDAGVYASILLTGDIHSVNQQAAGLPTRNDAKTFIYAFLYGAGDVKIGSIVAPLATEAEQAKIGKRLKQQFLNKTPALKKLREAVAAKVQQNGYLVGLDGRKLHVRSSHAALNTLLQSAGALIAKMATILAYEALIAMGYKWGKDFAMVAHVHDEMQFEVRKGLEQTVGEVVVQAMRDAGKFFNFKCPIDGEFKIGSNWKETH